MKESCWWVAESELPQTAWASNDGQTNRCYLLKIYIYFWKTLLDVGNHREKPLPACSDVWKVTALCLALIWAKDNKFTLSVLIKQCTEIAPQICVHTTVSAVSLGTGGEGGAAVSSDLWQFFCSCDRLGVSILFWNQCHSVLLTTTKAKLKQGQTSMF